MTEILEVPVDAPEPVPEPPAELAEIPEVNENSTEVNENTTNPAQEIPEPETPAPKKKGRGRPAGAKNKPKPKRLPSPEPQISPEPVRQVPQVQHHSPPPVDPTVALLGLLKSQMDQRQAMKRQKYAGWVNKF